MREAMSHAISDAKILQAYISPNALAGCAISKSGNSYVACDTCNTLYWGRDRQPITLDTYIYSNINYIHSVDMSQDGNIIVVACGDTTYFNGYIAVGVWVDSPYTTSYTWSLLRPRRTVGGILRAMMSIWGLKSAKAGNVLSLAII